jgi:NADPH:quinone reductase-like Zn-dependent oxidoreductase
MPAAAEAHGMKAIVRTRYGPADTVRVAEVARPAPAETEVLIRVRAASVNPLDVYLMQGMPWNRVPGLDKPKCEILGCDIAGQVEAVGSKVKQFQKGDEVFGTTSYEGGGFAEYACAAEEKLALKPEALSFSEAAAIPIAGCTALQGLRDKGRVQPGQKVLIEGASGGVGTFAVQLAKVFGAEVTAVGSTRSLDRLRALGADHGIDRTQVDFVQSSMQDGSRYDVILGVSAHHSIAGYRRVLTRQGIYVAIGGGPARIGEALTIGKLTSLFGQKKARFFIAKINRKDLDFLTEMMRAGKVTAVLDRDYPLENGAEALRYVAQGHAQGKVILTV